MSLLQFLSTFHFAQNINLFIIKINHDYFIFINLPQTPYPSIHSWRSVGGTVLVKDTVVEGSFNIAKKIIKFLLINEQTEFLVASFRNNVAPFFSVKIGIVR